MSSLLKRHSTLLAFTLSIASSVAFVACGDDDPTPSEPTEGGTTGGKPGTGGSGTGAKPGTGGTATGGGGGAGGGPTGGTGGKATGGTTPTEGGPDTGSNDSSDASDD